MAFAIGGAGATTGGGGKKSPKVPRKPIPEVEELLPVDFDKVAPPEPRLPDAKK